MKTPGGRKARRGTEAPDRPDHPTDMTNAVRVAQGGAESHPFQGIAGQFPTIYRQKRDCRPGLAGTAAEWQSGLGVYS
jgi:hypothetical protein